MSHNSRSAAPPTAGNAVFGPTLLLVVGVFQALMGIAAIARGRFFVVANGYAYNIGTTAWGAIHLTLGAALILTALGAYRRFQMLRGIGIALAVLSAIDSFFFVPYFPVWSLLIIGIDVVAIWALVNAGRPAGVPGRGGGPPPETRHWPALDEARYQRTPESAPRTEEIPPQQSGPGSQT